MKIYEIGTGYTPIPAQMGAATEIVVEELTRSFMSLGENVEIIDISSRDRAEINLPIIEVPVPACFLKDDVSLGIIHKVKRVVYSVSLVSKLKKLLKKSDEEVFLHFHNQYNLFFYLKLMPESIRKKATVAYTVHSHVWGDEWGRIEEEIKKKYFQEVYCVRNADYVFVLNDITRDHFENRLGVNPDNIHRIINGVSTQKYFPLSSDTIENLKSEHGLEHKKIILQVGSVCERKNQFGSVDMLSEYLKDNKDVVYLYAGGVIDSEYQQKIKDFAFDRGISEQVIYAGELSPGDILNQYYNMSDCCVFTSTRESFGLVIIEAIASGTPVILGSKPMFDLNKGYFNYKDKAEFVSLVDSCLNKLSKCDSSEVTDKYNWNAVARLHLDIFKKNQERSLFDVKKT